MVCEENENYIDNGSKKVQVLHQCDNRSESDPGRKPIGGPSSKRRQQWYEGRSKVAKAFQKEAEDVIIINSVLKKSGNSNYQLY
jgi:hypothetical protein